MGSFVNKFEAAAAAAAAAASASDDDAQAHGDAAASAAAHAAADAVLGKTASSGEQSYSSVYMKHIVTDSDRFKVMVGKLCLCLQRRDAPTFARELERARMEVIVSLCSSLCLLRLISSSNCSYRSESNY